MLIDILVDARCKQGLRNTRLPCRASENQRFLLLSDRHEGLGFGDGQEMDVVLDEDGMQVVYGYSESWMFGGILL